MPSILLTDSSALFDLKKGGLLPFLGALPYKIIVPRALVDDEILSFTESDWSLLKRCGVQIEGLDSIKAVMELTQQKAKLSFYDCLCLVMVEKLGNAILITGDGLLRSFAEERDNEVHGVLWIVQQIYGCNQTHKAQCLYALDVWENDPDVFFTKHIAAVRKQLK